MSDRTSLYLFKAARRPLYRKENLHLLAAERGSVVEVGYNRMWVSPEYFEPGSIARGTPVYIAFTERPYNLFVPVRQGEVVDVERDDLMLRMRVLLHSWVGVEDRSLEDFTRAVRESSRGDAPGTKFVAPKRDDVPLQAYYDVREHEGWCRAVDGVLRMSRECEDDPYRSSVFFRPAGLCVGGEVHVARTVPLEAGAEASLLLRFHNPHLEGSESGGHSLRVLAPEDALRVDAPEAFPLSGELEIPFQCLGGEPELTVQVLPSPSEHTSVTQRFASSRGNRTVQTEAAGDVERDELRGLYESVRRNARFDAPEDELNVVAEFRRLLPRESRIAEREGILLAQRGDEGDAYRVLRELNPELLGDDARFVLFGLLLRRDTASTPDRHVVSLDLASEGRFGRLLREMERLDPRTLGRLLPPLVLDLPDDQRREMLDRLGRRLESPTSIVETARNLWLSEDAAWAFDYLAERRRALRLDDPEVLDTLFELAGAGGIPDADVELANDAGRRIGNLVERGRVEDARDLLRKVRGALGRSQRDRIHHRIADQLAGKGEHAQAAEVMLELVYAACETGDLDEAIEAAESATEAVTRAQGLLTRAKDDSGFMDLLTDARRRVEAAWQECSRLAEWRRSAEEYRRERMQRALRNQRILIAGGVRNPEWMEHLRELTGADVDWCESFHDQVGNVDAFAGRIRQRSYALVVHYLQKAGHDLGGKLKPACEAAGIPFVAMPSAGRNGAVEAVWRVVQSGPAGNTLESR